MENASKALIMAGGMLLAILIISLLIYAWSLFSKYQSSQDELSNIEDTAKFNEQFTNYDRNDVQGYEILSLVNKVIDYNYRKSSAAGAKNDDKYPFITLIIDFGSTNNIKDKLTKDKTRPRVFQSTQYTQSDTANTFGTIITQMNGIENLYGGADYATKMAKGIDGIILSNEQLAQNRSQGITDNDSKTAALKKFNSCSNNKKYNNYDLMASEQKEHIYSYYEYMQFKRALFNSVSNAIKYDDENGTGRIIQMKFEFTGKLY